jgi:hypothetical protein
MHHASVLKVMRKSVRAQQKSYREAIAAKQRAKERVWSMQPRAAQDFACMVPPGSSLERVSRNAW